MLVKNKKKILTLALIGSMVFPACVDNKYDLADIDTDDVQVGGDVVAPLGSGSIEASKLLDTEHVKEISVDKDGNYVVAYKNSLDVGMPSDVTLRNVHLTLPSLEIPSLVPSQVVIDRDMTFPLGESTEQMDFTLPQEIVRLDSVRFAAADDAAVFDVYAQARDFFLLQGAAEAVLRVVFPDEYELLPLSGAGTVQDGTLVYRVSLEQLVQGVHLPVKVNKAVNGPVTVVTEITVSAGSELWKGSDARLYLSADFRNLDYEVVYGAFDMTFDVDPTRLDMNDFNDIFEGDDNYLSFADPHVKLNTESNIGIPLTGSMTIGASAPSKPSRSTVVSGIDVEPAARPGEIRYNRLWIGDSGSQVENGYRLVENNDLRELIAMSPTQVMFGMSVGVPESDEPQFFTRNPYAHVCYDVEIPFAVTKEFRANVSEMIDGVFDEDVVDYLFTNGSATISGKVKNTVPLNIEMNLVIEDESGRSVGITFEPALIAGSPDGEVTISEVAYTIRESDMEKMKEASNIRLLLVVTSDESLAGKYLKEGQKLELELKLLKKGGIPLN